MWGQRLRLWSAVLVCGAIMAAGLALYLLGAYAIGLHRDIRRWRKKRRLYRYSQKALKADS